VLNDVTVKQIREGFGMNKEIVVFRREDEELKKKKEDLKEEIKMKNEEVKKRDEEMKKQITEKRKSMIIGSIEEKQLRISFLHGRMTNTKEQCVNLVRGHNLNNILWSIPKNDYGE
jgi:hypothetical protein